MEENRKNFKRDIAQIFLLEGKDGSVSASYCIRGSDLNA